MIMAFGIKQYIEGKAKDTCTGVFFLLSGVYGE